ncbi:hypothetical protein IU399_00935 [Salmonella enterica subsp. enterica serovar Worthington]|nr:hypothetical protein [Salmonella enterica subsp. enterica serovar Worthington]
MPHMTGSDENSHLNGLFFPLVWQFVVKFAASSGSLLLRLLITARRFGEILEKRKIDHFQYSKSTPSSE